MITKIPSQKMHLILSNSSGKIDAITGDISYGRWLIRDSGENGDKPRVLESLSQIMVLAPFTHRERQVINLLSKGYDRLLPCEAFVTACLAAARALASSSSNTITRATQAMAVLLQVIAVVSSFRSFLKMWKSVEMMTVF